MPYILIVSKSIGHTILSNQVHKSCVDSIEGHELPVDLIILDIQYFDAILGINGLWIYHAKLNWFHKIVTFHPSKGQVIRL